MNHLRHERERRFHRFRYGFGHFDQHRRFEQHRHRRGARSSARWTWPWIAAGVAGAGLAIIVLIGVLVLINLERARGSLDQARASLTTIDEHASELASAQGRSAALVELRAAQAQAASAESTLRGTPLAGLLERVPVLGRQFTGAVDLATDVHTATGLGVTLLERVSALQQASSGTTVSLPQLADLQSSVGSASVTLAGLERPSAGLVAPLGSARASFDHEIVTIKAQLDRGSGVLSFLSTFLGGDGPRSYLLAAENQAEMRDQGSVLSVAQLSAAGGHLDASSPTSVSDYTLSAAVDYPIPAGTQAVFGLDRPTQLWQSANLTADFPWSGGDLVAMYKAATGIQDDGAVAIDVHALSAVLAVSGPVVVPGIGVPVTSANVTPLLLDSLYERNPLGPQDQRQDETAAVATAAVKKLSAEHVDLASLARALTTEIAGRHLLLYDAEPAQQQILTAYGATGAVDAADPQRTFHLAIENATASKLDYFLSTDISQRVVVSTLGSASVVTTVTVSNHAPAHHAASEQFGPDGRYAHVPGEYAGTAYLWSPATAIAPGSISESGLELSARNLDLLPGQSTTLSFTSIIPKALRGRSLTIHWIPQPTVRAEQLDLVVSGIGSERRAPSTSSIELHQGFTGTWSFPG